MSVQFATVDAWREEAARLFGPDPMKWRFVCPVCKHEAAVEDWKAAGAAEGEVAFSCVGRHIPGSMEAFVRTKKGPCDYAGGGLFHLNPIQIEELDHKVFAFAEVPTT